MMRTLYLRVAITFTLTLVLSLAASLWIAGNIARRANGDFFEGLMNLELQQAERIYTTQGPQPLAEYLTETDNALRGKRYLIDGDGRDLVSGENRSAMVVPGSNGPGSPNQAGQFVIVKASPDGKYRLLVEAPPPLGAWRFLPYFLLIGMATALLSWALSAGIVTPLRHVAHTVDRFGRGDLSARVEQVNASRRDEIGNLARSFNGMAERIGTLVTAERRLLQDVSHELRSPLARLSFAAELMKDTLDPEAASTCMRREIERLSQLVSTLVEVTSAEGDPASRRTQRLVVPELVREIVDHCGFEADARNVSIDTEVRSSAAVDGDPELLRRAVENVLRNAIRFAPPESRVLVKVEDKGRNVAVLVQDSGPGVPEDLLTRIFDPFFRVDESRDGSQGGTGLGLSIARRAVQLHHGEITAENAFPGLRVNIAIPSI